MERVIIYSARRYVYRKLAFCLVLAGLGGGLLAARIVAWLGWGLAFVGAGYALLLLRALGEDTERVVIDDSGIRDTLLPVGTIGWDEMRGVTVQDIGGTAVVALEVRDPERFIRRLPNARQFIARKALESGLPGLYLTLVGTDAEPAEVAESIRRRLRISASGT